MFYMVLKNLFLCIWSVSWVESTLPSEKVYSTQPISFVEPSALSGTSITGKL